MIVINSPEELCKYRSSIGDKTLGFVPTMGALHLGHLSLVAQSKIETDLTVVSIFVNPTQFNNTDDFNKYPSLIDQDLALLKSAEADVVFIPSTKDIYPSQEKIGFNLGVFTETMEGKYRPGHFDGVAQIISIFFELLSPHKAFFGEKDFQQLAVIRQLTQREKYPVEIVGCPTFREEDGLAMSSRNLNLTPEGRAQAPLIFKCLSHAKTMVDSHSPTQITEWVSQAFGQQTDLKLEYFSLIDSTTLEPIEKWSNHESATACIAAFSGSVRLIDNISLY